MAFSPSEEVVKIAGDSVHAPIVNCFSTPIAACTYDPRLHALCTSMRYVLYRSLPLPKVGTVVKYIATVFLYKGKIPFMQL